MTERRSDKPTRRANKKDWTYGTVRSERRYEERMSGRTGITDVSRPGAEHVGATPTDDSLVQIKTHEPRPERRIGGAGRRAGDLARALETGESVIFQMGKGSWAKSAGKLAKVAAKTVAKKLPVIGAILTAADYASDAKAVHGYLSKKAGQKVN